VSILRVWLGQKGTPGIGVPQVRAVEFGTLTRSNLLSFFLPVQFGFTDTSAWLRFAKGE
jgi:hypothetical protein